MKRALFLFVFMSLMCHSFSQGNLQFNRVLSLTNGSNSSVPTGKVWKVESVNLSSSVNFAIGALTNVNCITLTGTIPQNRQCDYAGVYINIAGVSFSTPTMSHITLATTCSSPCTSTNPVALSTSSLNVSSLNFPIWLEAGKNITIANGTGVLVSIIEFNVIP